jgi:cytochrome b6-f complex iron-sulfur subunit
MHPSDGSWQVVAASADVPAGEMHHFDVGSVVGFVSRVNGQPEAVSGVCAHQGCRLWFDRPLDQLRCPCHSTAFSPTGQVVNHLLVTAPEPLPRPEVREQHGSVEVFVAQKPPNEPA